MNLYTRKLKKTVRFYLSLILMVSDRSLIFAIFLYIKKTNGRSLVRVLENYRSWCRWKFLQKKKEKKRNSLWIITKIADCFMCFLNICRIWIINYHQFLKIVMSCLILWFYWERKTWLKSNRGQIISNSILILSQAFEKNEGLRCVLI